MGGEPMTRYEKAARLIGDGKVTKLADSMLGATLRVEGDHGTYLVAVDRERGVIACSCISELPDCSHAIAAWEVLNG